MGRPTNRNAIEGYYLITLKLRYEVFTNRRWTFQRKLRSVQKSFDVANVAQSQFSVEDKQSNEEETMEKVSNVEAAADDKSQAPKITAPPESKQPFPEKPVSEADYDSKANFPTGSFEDNFENFDEVTESITTTSKNDMTDSMYSTSSETAQIKDEKPKLSEEETELMRVQLEHAEYLQLKSILQAKINSERFEIVKLRSHMAIKNKQENNISQNNAKEILNNQVYTENEKEERLRLIKENILLGEKRLSLINQIFQEKMSCIQLKIQIAMNEIL